MDVPEIVQKMLETEIATAHSQYTLVGVEFLGTTPLGFVFCVGYQRSDGLKFSTEITINPRAVRDVLKPVKQQLGLQLEDCLKQPRR